MDRRLSTKICSINGCGAKHYAKGFCHKHHQRNWLNGMPFLIDKPIICQAPGCEESPRKLGLCMIHYTRKRRDGTFDTSRIVNNNKLRLELNSHFDKNGCRIWDRSMKNGYGVAYLNGRLEQAHRASWKVINGEIPKGMQVNHKCHVRACINIEHLYLGTQKQNVADMYLANRQNRPRGSASGMSKLTEDQVREIRAAIVLKVLAKDIAKKYNVSTSLIYNIKNRVGWQHV